jgi:hypothetical protein
MPTFFFPPPPYTTITHHPHRPPTHRRLHRRRRPQPQRPRPQRWWCSTNRATTKPLTWHANGSSGRATSTAILRTPNETPPHPISRTTQQKKEAREQQEARGTKAPLPQGAPCTRSMAIAPSIVCSLLPSRTHSPTYTGQLHRTTPIPLPEDPTTTTPPSANGNDHGR